MSKFSFRDYSIVMRVSLSLSVTVYRLFLSKLVVTREVVSAPYAIVLLSSELSFDMIRDVIIYKFYQRDTI